MNAVQSYSRIFSSNLTQIVMGTLLIFLCSQITIPLEPVPITLQSVSIMFIGLTYSRKNAIQSVLSYLILGALGLPVFANYSGGFHSLIGPTGGYLFGFLAAAYLMATIREKINLNNLGFMIANSLIGTVILFIFGVSWLSFFIGIEKGITLGLVPFIIPGIIKAVILALGIRYLKPNSFFKK
ncbi:MAG: biotin transporter BioY [Sphingobacteriia bacterium]|nr:biotin transporter BioY [Sphingobacteriia bacterium]